MNQLDFFEKLSSELAFASVPPNAEDIMNFINSSRSTHLIYTNMSSGEILEGPFYLEKNFLVYYQAEGTELPEILLDVSYARLQTVFRCNQKSAPKIFLSKNQNTYEIVFDDQNDHDDWMLKLRKYCILTNFEKKYHIAEVTEKKGEICECLLETKMGGNHYSARKFDKEQMASSKNPFTKTHLMNEIGVLRVLRTKRFLNLKEVYETEDSIYLVTDVVHNLTLKKMLRAASSPFSASKTKNLMHQLLKVLAEMASKKIVHRNLKPSSVLMEDNHNLRIINFGLATYMNAPKANVGIYGTPGYIAPELLNCHHENRVYDDKVDVFSAGCIFFEMLFGYPLFKGSKSSEISSLNKHFKYSDLIQLVMKEKRNPQPNSSLDLLLKLLHNDPKQRISAEEALADPYFGSQESSSPPKKLSMDEGNVARKSSKGRLSMSPQNPRNRVSFDISTSLRGSLSETVSSQESSTPSISSNSSFRKLSDDTPARSRSPSRFKPESKLKNTPEIQSSIPLREFSENSIMPKINLNETCVQNDEDTAFDETSPVFKNCPIASPGTQKHPSQRT